MNYSDKDMHIREYKGIILFNVLYVLVTISWFHSFVSKIYVQEKYDYQLCLT